MNFQKAFELGTQSSCFLLAVGDWGGAGALRALTSSSGNQSSQGCTQPKGSTLKLGTVGVWAAQQPQEVGRKRARFAMLGLEMNVSGTSLMGKSPASSACSPFAVYSGKAPHLSSHVQSSHFCQVCVSDAISAAQTWLKQSSQWGAFEGSLTDKAEPGDWWLPQG